MKETFYVNCVNCGKQVLIEDKTSICYWCHKNASKKEDKTNEKMSTLRMHNDKSHEGVRSPGVGMHRANVSQGSPGK